MAGSLGGRRLEGPPGIRARPTTDRVREALFNALQARQVLSGARVLDLYAGTGALGIEALSRGAAHVTFVERDPVMLGVLTRNLDQLDLTDRSQVVRADATAVTTSGAARGEWWDLALLDPPYAFDAWEELLAGLPATVAVLETAEAPRVPDSWHVLRQKRYGGTLITVAEQPRPARPARTARGEP